MLKLMQWVDVAVGEAPATYNETDTTIDGIKVGGSDVQYLMKNNPGMTKSQAAAAIKDYVGTPGSGGKYDLGSFDRRDLLAQLKSVTTPEEGGEEGGMLSGSELQSFLADMAEADMQTRLKYMPQIASQNYSLAGQYMPQYQSLFDALRTQDRTANLNDIRTFTPQLNQITELSQGPQVTSIRNILQQQILDEIGRGGELTPEMVRDVSQGARAAEMARGMSGAGSANREAVARALRGRELLAERQGKASAFLSLDKSLRADPFATVTNLPESSGNKAFSAFASSLGTANSQLPTSLQAQSVAQNQAAHNLQATQYANQLNLMNQYLPMLMS